MQPAGNNRYDHLVIPQKSFLGSISGETLPVTAYMLVYTAYTIVFANDMDVNLIRFSYGVYYAMTAWFMFKSITFYKTSKFYKSSLLLLILFVVYGVILYITGTAGWKKDIPPSAFLLDYLPRILPLFAFYYFGRKGIINERWFKIFFVLFFLDVVLLYLFQQKTLIENSLNGQEDFVNNSGYLVASLLPLICFFDKNKTIQFLLAAVIIGFTIICFKRGAVLCAGFSFIYFMYMSFKTTKTKNKVMVLLLIFVLIYLLSGFIENLMDSNDLFFNRVMETKEGKSSERDSIYSFFLQYFFSSENCFNFLLGNGAYGTSKIYGTEAHSDWLEMAIDFGVVGLIVFFLFWIRIYKNIQFAKNRISSAFRTAIIMCFIFNFSRTFFSMSISDLSFISASVLGCGMGLIDRERSVHLSKKNYNG